MEDDKIESASSDTIIDLGNYGAAQPTYTLGSGYDTITIDTSLSACNTFSYPNVVYTGSSGTSSTLNWSSNYYTNPSVNINSDGINMPAGSDIKVGDKSLTAAIEKIEERLGILTPNPELEDRWDQLKELRRQYIELEKDLLEKEKMWEILKKA